ncbi:hypothetical protein ACHAQD_008418 [Fusarium lateritium]
MAAPQAMIAQQNTTANGPEKADMLSPKTAYGDDTFPVTTTRHNRTTSLPFDPVYDDRPSNHLSSSRLQVRAAYSKQMAKDLVSTQEACCHAAKRELFLAEMVLHNVSRFREFAKSASTTDVDNTGWEEAREKYEDCADRLASRLTIREMVYELYSKLLV